MDQVYDSVKENFPEARRPGSFTGISACELCDLGQSPSPFSSFKFRIKMMMEGGGGGGGTFSGFFIGPLEKNQISNTGEPAFQCVKQFTGVKNLLLLNL